ncbi:MAG: prephenate dehydratase [Thermodesulfobacteriota bacterium]|nr:prephenate dehydratase [Thermodesulfobacteriota bacterium]
MNPSENGRDQQIAALRVSIDAIDADILDLLNRRIDLAAEIGQCKRQAGSFIQDKAREEAILQGLIDSNTGRLDNAMLRRIFSEIMAASRQVQDVRKIAYLGPEATFTHVAAMAYFDPHDTFVPQLSIRDVFEEVEKDACTYGVVPVENSIEGSVNHTLDLFPESSLNICAEKYLTISHDLLSVSGRLEDVRIIYSHPQPFAQCRGWLKKHLPGAELLECSSTAEAARKAVQFPEAAAIAGGAAGRLYDLNVVASKIQDFVRNTTRFLIIGKKTVPSTGSDKTSIMFVTAHMPGALFKVLEPIADSGINMLKLESRPAKYENWSYVFFVDLEGHAEDEIVKNTLAQMKPVCQFLKILGSYQMMNM